MQLFYNVLDYGYCKKCVQQSNWQRDVILLGVNFDPSVSKLQQKMDEE